MIPGYEIQPISSVGRSQNSCPTKLEEQSDCIARIFIILYNENKAPLNLGFVHGHSSLPHFLNPSSQTGQRLVPMKLPERWIVAAQSLGSKNRPIRICFAIRAASSNWNLTPGSKNRSRWQALSLLSTAAATVL